MVHTILSLAMGRIISDDSLVVQSLQRLSNFFIIETDLENARSCYQTTIEYLKDAGLRRHVTDCSLRLGIILLLEGKIQEAK